MQYTPSINTKRCFNYWDKEFYSLLQIQLFRNDHFELDNFERILHNELPWLNKNSFWWIWLSLNGMAGRERKQSHT